MSSFALAKTVLVVYPDTQAPLDEPLLPTMDLVKMITELQDERQRLDEAIEALERLSAGAHGQRRGRPSRTKPDELDGEQPSSTDKIDSLPSPRSKKT